MEDEERPVRGREVTVEEARDATKASVHELAPLVVADPPVPVEVWDPWTRDWCRGRVKAWRGPRVNVEYARAPGMTYLVWLPADCVRRIDPAPPCV